MVELIFIIINFFLFYFLLTFNIFVIDKGSSKINNFTLIENINFNSIILLSFILFASFLNLSLNHIIILYFSYLLILLILYLNKFKTVFIFKKKEIFYLLTLFIVSCTVFLEIANNLIIAWDAQKFWIYKTLNFYNGNSISNLSNIPNSWYPYLGSLAWSFFWKVSLIDNEYTGRLFFALLYLSSLLMLVSNLKVSLIFKIILFIIFIIISYDYTYHSHWSMFAGNQEILIFSLICIAMHFFYKMTFKKENFSNVNILSILIISNLLIWIKHEGLILSSLLIITLLLFFKINRLKKVYIFLSFLGILFLRYFIFEYYSLNSSNIQHVGYNDLSLSSIIEKISFDRILIVTKIVFLNLFSNYLLLLGIILICLFFISKNGFSKINYIIFFGGSNLLCFSFLYLITDADITYMLETGIDRIIYQFSPFIFLLFIEYFNSVKKIKV